MNPLTNPEDGPSSGSESGDVLPSLQPPKKLKPKMWRYQPVQEYTDNLLILSCLDIVEGGEKLRTCEIHYQLFASFHARVANHKLYKRPEELLHPLKLLEVTAFRSQNDWTAWCKSEKVGTGKASATDSSLGLLSAEHADWASKKYEKYKLLKREIYDSVQRTWSLLVPNNSLPSGIKLAEKVEELRSKMFDVWKFSKTSNQSKTEYADQQMVGPCADWHPTWWNSWKMMGPAGVQCSATIMSECGMKIETVIAPLPGLLESHFGTNHEANVQLQSRRALQKELQAKVKLETGLPATPASSESDALQSRVRSMDTKALLDVRRHEIQRLEFLIKSPLCTPAEQLAFNQQLFQFMKNPIMSDFTGSFRSSPVFVDSQNTEDDSTSTLSTLLRQSSGATVDVCQKPLISLASRVLPALLQMPTVESDDLAASFSYEEEEAAVRGEEAAAPVNFLPGDTVSKEVLWLLAKPTKGNGACCPISIFEALLLIRAGNQSLFKGRMQLSSERSLRQSVVDWIDENSHVTLDCLGSLTFRAGIRAEYIKGSRELRDSDYIRAAMEAEPQEDPVQHVSSFFGWISAMRQPRAYGDEFFIAGAAMLYDCEICVARKFSETGNIYQPHFYSSARPRFRIFLCADSDHYEPCIPDDPVSLLKRIAILPWVPPPLYLDDDYCDSIDGLDNFDAAAESFFDTPVSAATAANAASAKVAAQDSAALTCAHEGASDAASAVRPATPKPSSVATGNDVSAATAATAVRPATPKPSSVATLAPAHLISSDMPDL
jgi:hypothetical protein